jgi:hypothetical protein
VQRLRGAGDFVRDLAVPPLDRLHRRHRRRQPRELPPPRVEALAAAEPLERPREPRLQPPHKRERRVDDARALELREQRARPLEVRQKLREGAPLRVVAQGLVRHAHRVADLAKEIAVMRPHPRGPDIVENFGLHKMAERSQASLKKRILRGGKL